MAAQGEGRRDRRVATGLALGFFVLYALTLCRGVYWYDSAEYVTAAVTLGIPHPPGYPLYTLLAHVFTWLPVEPALAVNGMSSFFAALCVGLVYLVGRRLQCSPIAAGIAAGVLGVSRVFWTNAVIAEVYCPALASCAAVLLLLLRYRETGRARHAAIAAGLAGLSLGIHLSIATLGLGFGLLVWAGATEVRHPDELRSLFDRATVPRRVGHCLAAAASAGLGSLIFLYLPLRASMDPALNVGNPSTRERFVWHITGGNYKDWFLDVSFVDRSSEIFGLMQAQVSILGVVLALVGVLALLRRAPVAGIALPLMIAGNLGFFYDYNVHDLEVFFLPSVLVLCIAIGPGVQSVLDGVASVVSEEKRVLMTRLVGGGLVAFVAFIGVGNHASVDKSDFDDAERYIAAVDEVLPPNAVILDFTTPPEWAGGAVWGMYAQKVHGLRPDVRILNPRSGPELLQMIADGTPVFAYAPVGQLRGLDIVGEGPLIRVRGVLPAFASPPPPPPPAPPPGG